ncbi:MAG: DUF4956 domain-containing protein [Prolixibacteraceae bacterium]|jgi:hypothetical protein|nr:DUF4956 domain-containing protein [Prolixibacteraceae bacterium]
MIDINAFVPLEFLSPALLELISLLVVFRLIYTPSTLSTRRFLFSYFAISASVFILSFLLHHLEFELSLAVGLFAIFGILRFRTDPIPIKEMSYLFTGITISVINALSFDFFVLHQVLIANVLLWILLAFMERVFYKTKESCLPLLYDRLDLLAPEKREDLLEDLRSRTGLDISKVKIKQFDLLKETAELVIYFLPRK